MKPSKIFERGKQYAWHALLGCICLFSLPANAATVYFNDFQTAVVSGWSTAATNGIQITSAPNPDYDGNRLFLGQYGNDTLTLSLGALPVHSTATVSFSLYLIGSWDGNDTTKVNGVALGPDNWEVSLGSTILFDQTFSNGNPAGQSYSPSPGATSCNPGYNSVYSPGTYNPMTGAAECYSLGYMFTYPVGYVYSDGHTCTNPNGCAEAMDSVYNLSFTFNDNASDMVLNFSANGLQGLADESWGLDNVTVRVSAVPVLPAAWLFGSGLITLVAVARRKKPDGSPSVAV